MANTTTEETKMTNAIEQAKREMYSRLADLKQFVRASQFNMKEFEGTMESYLELLRQDHESLHETARARFEDIQKLESVNQDLSSQVKRMQERHEKLREDRDSIQLRLHAVDHAYKTQQDRMAIPVKDSGDRGAYEAVDANAGVIRAAVRSIQLVITDWGMGDLKAKKAMRQIARIVNGDGTVAEACGSLEKDRYELDEKSLKMRAMLDAVDQHKRGTCMHSFFANGQDQMKCTFCGVGK
jgi:prefoldin subunit 5